MNIEEAIQFHEQCAKNAPTNIIRQTHNSIVATLKCHKDITQSDYCMIIRNTQKAINHKISHLFLSK